MILLYKYLFIYLFRVKIRISAMVGIKVETKITEIYAL